MKKILLIALTAGILFSFNACKKEKEEPQTADPVVQGPAEIIATQQSTVFYMSGNWCGPCGLYGVPAKANAKTKFGDKVNFIACQLNGPGSTDPYNNANANSLAAVFNASGVPTAFIMANNLGISVSGGSGMSSSMETAISNQISNTDVIANFSIDKAKLDGTNLTVDIRTKFFKAGADEYRLAAYVVENSLSNQQNVSGAGWQTLPFESVLRKSLTTVITGEMLVTNAEANKEYAKTYTSTVDASWKKENLKVIVVLWKATPNSSGGTSVSVVNSLSKKLD